MREALEENLKRIEETKEKLEKITFKINNYNESHANRLINDDSYKLNLDKRDNLAIALNYYQNQVIIEQNKEIINNLNTLIRNTK